MAAARDLDDLSAFLLTGDAGEVIFRKGDDGADLFVVQQGQVELLDDLGDGERRLALLDVGDVFGDGQVFDGGPRPVAARAVSEYQLLKVDRAALEQMAAEDPAVALGLIERLSRRAWPPPVAPGSPAPAARKPAAAPEKPRAPRQSVPDTGAPWLVVADSDVAFALAAKPEFIVGRIDRSTGYIPEIDLTPYDEARSLSRRHARLVSREGRLFVREEKSTRNGTFINGTRLETGAEVELSHGTRIRFGLVETVFERR